MTAPLWQPQADSIAASQMTAFKHLLEQTFDCELPDYDDLHRWSLEHSPEFWSLLWDYCDIKGQRTGPVLTPSDHPWGVSWFQDSTLNFAENLLKHRDEKIALVGLLENGQRQQFSYNELYTAVAKVAAAMRAHGIKAGDRITGLMPNIPQTVIAMLATASIGAIWSSCSPDFGANAAIDRFDQIQPRLLFSTNAYMYNGKTIELTDKINEIRSRIDSIEKVIVFDLIDSVEAVDNTTSWQDFTEAESQPNLMFAPLPFNHPLYIMYSSGTTGIPKCIVHGAGGTLLQHLKEHRLHLDLSREDTFFYFTTCGWMMWNWLVSGLATGATLVLFDGSPFANDGDILLDAIDDESITIFGTSAKYLANLEKIGKRPAETHDLSTLRSVLSTGSPLNHNSYDYVYRDIKSDIHLASISGGTDIISCFILGNTNLPVYRGELQCLGLGMAVAFRREGRHATVGEQGELVCTQPFPSAPIGFWNDVAHEKFRAAYFDQQPGVWTHGDFGEQTQQGGYLIHGRSDATLNPAGVRIGTAEIYRQIETLPEVIEGIVVGQEWQGDERVVLFVVLAESLALDETLKAKIKQTIKEGTSPRHVPAVILQVADIPRTLSGKIVELAVRDVIHGRAVANTASLANPEALDHFKDLNELNS